MKLLVLDWGAYTQFDINDTFQRNNITYKQVNYFFNNKNHDDFFYRHFKKYVSSDCYDAVFTVNYFPLVAQVCHESQIKYLSWSYDNPLNVPQIEDTLGYPTNYVFLFDRIQATSYQAKGYSNVYHLPLAVNPYRLNKLSLTTNEHANFSSEIAFVGKLYPSSFNELLMPLDEYYKGYLQALVTTQSKVYGYYMLDDLLTNSIIESINKCYQKYTNNDNFSISREAISYSMATHITREERLLLLNLLSKRHQVSLYSPEKHPLLSQVAYHGTAKYMTDMYKIFHASKINLNITLKILQSGMPLRALDILGAGGFLLSNYQPELVENFIPDVDAVYYSDIPDALDKAAFWLSHEELRQTIAINGQRKVFQQFNYEKQLKTIFATAGLI